MEAGAEVSAKRTPESVLQRIDGWADAVIEELAGGLTNRTFLVTADSKRGVLKMDDEPRDPPFNRRDVEARIQASANEATLAPAVLYSDEQCYLTQYAEGQVWRPQHLQSSENLDKLGRALRRLHSLPLSGRTFNAPDAARVYLGRIDDHSAARVEECVRIVDSMPSPMNLCLCHNDLVVGNIVDSGEPMFLDWEYACDNDPFFDLATVVAHHAMDEWQVDSLLSAYFDGDWQRWRPQLERQMEVYSALLWLWQAARATGS